MGRSAPRCPPGILLQHCAHPNRTHLGEACRVGTYESTERYSNGVTAFLFCSDDTQTFEGHSADVLGLLADYLDDF